MTSAMLAGVLGGNGCCGDMTEAMEVDRITEMLLRPRNDLQRNCTLRHLGSVLRDP